MNSGYIDTAFFFGERPLLMDKRVGIKRSRPNIRIVGYNKNDPIVKLVIIKSKL